MKVLIDYIGDALFPRDILRETFLLTNDAIDTEVLKQSFGDGLKHYFFQLKVLDNYFSENHPEIAVADIQYIKRSKKFVYRVLIKDYDTVIKLEANAQRKVLFAYVLDSCKCLREMKIDNFDIDKFEGFLNAFGNEKGWV